MSTAYLSTYEQDGIVMIPEVFTGVECYEMRAAAYGALDLPNPEYRHGAVEYAASGAPALVFWPALISPVLNSYRLRLAGIVRSFLGENVRQLNNQVYFRQSGDGDQFGWHTDMRFRAGEKPGIEDGYLQTIIALDGITEDNGAIEFVPGTHRGGQYHTAIPEGPLREFRRCDLRGVKYTAPVGSVLCWRADVIHGSEPNESGASRMTYMNGFAKAEYTDRWPWFLRDGELVAEINAGMIP